MKKLRKQPIHGRKSAAALRYRQGDDQAPRLVAKGMDTLAEKIMEAARQAGVPIYEDPDLVAMLMALDIDQMIPPELYVSVAEVLAFIYRINGKVAKER